MCTGSNDKPKKRWDNSSFNMVWFNKINFKELSEQSFVLFGNTLFNEFKEHEKCIREHAQSGNLVEYANAAIALSHTYNIMCELLDYIHENYHPDSIKREVLSLMHLHNYMEIAFGDEMDRLQKSSK